MKTCMVMLVVLVAACGGKKGKTTPDESGDSDFAHNGNNGGGDTDPGGGGGGGGGGDMIPPEKMDEVVSALKRKSMIISRCLATAVENKDVPKNTRGKIALEIIISPGGKATSVKVIKSEIESQVVQGCVTRHVEEISFPTLPKNYETSYTYSMEAN